MKDRSCALRSGYRWHGVVDYGVEAGYVDLGDTVLTFHFAEDAHSLVSRPVVLDTYLEANLNIISTIVRVSPRMVSGFGHACSESLIFFRLVDLDEGTVYSADTGGCVGLGVGNNFTPAFSRGLIYSDRRSRQKYSATEFGRDADISPAACLLSAERRF